MLVTEPKMKMLYRQSGDVTVTYADIANAQTNLGYHPETSLNEGLERFLENPVEYP